jgi:hypothetical protein
MFPLEAGVQSQDCNVPCDDSRVKGYKHVQQCFEEKRVPTQFMLDCEFVSGKPNCSER